MSQSTYSLLFNGTSGYVEKTSPTGLPAIGDAKSISLWTKHDGVAARRILFTLCKDNTSGANNAVSLALKSDGGLLVVAAEAWGGSSSVEAFIGPSDENIASDTWFHILYTCEAGQANPKIYINGHAWTYGAVTSTQTGAVGVVRAASFNSAYPDPYHNRHLDHIALFTGTLNGTQAAGLADGSIDPSTLSPALFWKFEEGSGTTAADSSGNGNDGTLNGGTTWSSDVPTPLAGGGGGTSIIPLALHLARMRRAG